MLQKVGSEIFLAHSGSEFNTCVSRGLLLHHVSMLLHQIVDLINRLLVAHATHLLVLHLLYDLITALRVLIHVFIAWHWMLSVLRRGATRQSAYGVVLWTTTCRKLIVSRVHLHVVELMMLVILVNERLLFALLLQLLVRRLSSKCGSTRLIIAKINLHGCLLGPLSLVSVRRLS